MNPGYAGRSELPDNLKALFRSVAMMVPDYALIAEIRLYSFGFGQAKPLSKKIVTTYKLCSEQISAQKHYDYGMRAVNSVLVAAGNLRKKDPYEDEDIQILKAINEVNEAKFLSIDLPLFKSIIVDLFPDTIVPESNFGKLTDCINESIANKHLQSKPYFTEKIIQLYQMILVRHGLMVVGEPYCGKTSAIEVLCDALGLMEIKQYGERKTEYICLNPKAMNNSQLYGITDIATAEWTDGVLPVKFKKLANDPTNNRQWLWFDGPVDAIWIEDMNTVLDDNKKLCLANGDIFYMSSNMNLIFEPMDLLVASPATVSRVGMIFMEPHMMGWWHLYESWKYKLPKNIGSYEQEDMDVYFLNVMEPILDMLNKKQFETTAPAMEQNIIETLLKIALPFMMRFENDDFSKSLEMKERRSFFDKVFTYGTVWSLGAWLSSDSRKKFDSSLKKIINAPSPSLSPEQAKKHRKIDLPEGGSGKVFDFTIEIEIEKQSGDSEQRVFLKWVRWSDKLNDGLEYSDKLNSNEIIVPTVDSVRYTHLITEYMKNMQNTLICGPTGTGKTIYIKKLMSLLDKSKFQTLEIGFSAQTTAFQVQEIIEGVLIRRSSKGIYGPPPGKKLLIFVDDLNMPKKEEYGAQPPIELLRQILDKKGWYDHLEKHKPFKILEDMIFISAMGPPGGGRNFITPRFQRLLCFISFTEIDDSQMELIFKTILVWKFKTGKFVDDVSKLTNLLIKGTLQIYQSVIENFKPTPAKSHYIFNMRDFARVINGFCLGDKDKINTKEMAVKLWIHEVWRVFSDRLNSEEDRLALLNKNIKIVSHKVLGENFDNLLGYLDKDEDGKIETLTEMRGLIFTDVLSMAGMKSKPYDIVLEYEKLFKACNNALKNYDLMSDKPLNIVLFNFAIEHMLIISRILKQPGANGLLVGIGGSGRQSLTKLAATIGSYNLFQIELSKTYGIEEWKTDLKLALKSAGGKAENSVFLFRDTQIKYESFIEDINNLLNNGEVPNLFQADERGEILEYSRKNSKDDGREDVESPEQLLAYFTETVKKKLHVILNFSPIGSNFRNKIRMFPALVNCCTIDWYFEWPQEALHSVAENFIGETKLPKDIKEKWVTLVQYFHMSTQDWARKFLNNLGRYYYVTPTSYIQMISQFKGLLEEKSNSVLDQQQKYSNGYTMIIEAEESVGGMKINLSTMVPELEKAAKEVAIILEETRIAQEKAEVIKKKVAIEEEKAKEKADKSKIISDDCKQDLDKVIPDIEKSLAVLEKLDIKDFSIMQTSNNPPQALVEWSTCLAIIMRQPEEKEMNPATMKNETNWKKTGKKVYSDVKSLLERMKTFNGITIVKGEEIDLKNEINIMDEKQYKQIDKLFTEKPDLLNEKKVRESSNAVGEIFGWIEGQRNLYPTELSARPKRKKYLEAQAEYDEAMAILEEKRKELREKEAELAILISRMEASKKQKDTLEKEYNKCKIQLERAEILIDNLIDEKARWKELAEQLKIEYDNLVGDVLVSSGVISYLGPFTSGYRSIIIKEWSAKSLEQQIPGSVLFNFVKTLGEPVKVRAWQINGLPSDDFSTENAIILSKTKSWALCIDPQTQANKWIKNTEKENKLIVTNFNSNFMGDIERAIRNGFPCLIENIGEEIDGSLDPVLLKQVVKGVIKLGEKMVDYTDSFFLYITSKFRNPHYLPEVSTKVTIINFMITFEGLSDQLLGTIVSLEMPEKEKEKNRLIAEGAQNKKELLELENEILQILSKPKAQLLESEESINVLTKSKKKSIDINEKQRISEITETEINEARKNYIEVSQVGSCLFFAISDLGTIDPMYQYSLNYYIELFKMSIDKSEKSSEIEIRLTNIKDHFLSSLYRNISRSLFVKDKLLFSFLLCIRLKQFKKELIEGYYEMLIVGTVGNVANKTPVPKETPWMKEANWIDIWKLSEFGGNFTNFHKEFIKHIPDWNRLYDSSNPLLEKFPEAYETKLDVFEKMLVMKIIRPDKIVPVIQNYVIACIGKEFVEIPPFNIEAIYNDSTNSTPLIFVLTPGVDPYNTLNQFANSNGIELEGVSLGQGQAARALELIHKASTNGSWAILQNCHLSPSFMNPLEKKWDEIQTNPGKLALNFRLWLTSYPSNDFPSSILQNGIKMTNEPPSGLRNNLKNAMVLDEISDPSHFNQSPNLSAYRRLTFGLWFFHALIQERKKYGPLGWNIPYEFTESDLRISAAQLRIFIEKYPDELPLSALKYLTAECNYGGRVTDDKDRRLIIVLLEDFYNIDVATIDCFNLAPGFSEYYVPDAETYKDYLKYIEDLPLNSSPEIIGFHINASITKEINETKLLLDTLVLCQGSGGEGQSGDVTDVYIDLIDSILGQLPELYNITEVKEKYPAMLEESMNTILVQELNRFNKLLQVIRESLSSIKDALKGLIVFSFELEDALNYIKVGKVPKMWMDYSFPTRKPLAAYIKNLLKRLEFFAEWIQKDKPIEYWISGFFFTHGFLTGVQQNFSRKYKIAIDKLKFDFEMIHQDRVLDQYPEDGAYVQGYFMEGAKFDYKRMSLSESDPKILYIVGPRMYLRPCLPEDELEFQHYECPLYKTSDRRGVLMTTGHSTNFVMMLKIPSDLHPNHWIKRGVAALTQLDD